MIIKSTPPTRVIFLCIVFLFAAPLYADTAADIQAKIDTRNKQIQELETQLKQYNDAALEANSEAKTLQGTIKTLDATQKKINSDIKLTNSKISRTGLVIQSVETNISTSTTQIEDNKASLAALLRTMRENDEISTMERVLGHDNIVAGWNDFNDSNKVGKALQEKSASLQGLLTTLASQKKNLEAQKENLVSLTQDLAGQKEAVVYTKQEKNTLLLATKNKENAYKQLASDTEAKKRQFEQEVYDFESQLRLSIDASSYPAPQKGILSWPVDMVYITQLFGKTVGAEKLYTSGSHNGVDFRASVGTKVKNVLDGVVVGTGNTDIYPGCYSFGKWVMVKHDNGLSTIYGHLSVISVSQGQQVTTGDLIGFSGNTGYSTGPHLHISVYATQGVRIEQFVQSRGCKQAVLPLADTRAYLDPMAYFPQY